MSSVRRCRSDRAVGICAVLLAAFLPGVTSAIAAQSVTNAASCNDGRPGTISHVRLGYGYIQKVAQPFLVQVDVCPPLPDGTSVEVQMEPGNIVYAAPGMSKNSFRLTGRQTKILQATVTKTQIGLDFMHAIGLVRVHGIPTPLEKGVTDGYWPVKTEYVGQLKPSSSEALPFEDLSTLFLRLVDPDGKPIRIDGPQCLHLYSADAAVSAVAAGDGEPAGVSSCAGFPNNIGINLPLQARETLSPQFNIRPKCKSGCSVHLTAILEYGNDVLAEETFVFAAKPAQGLLFILAIAGALLHALYKIARLSPFSRSQVLAIGITSLVAGIVAYLIANYDLFGLKLDPNAVRTYPLIGFLLSYFGVDVLANKFSVLKEPGGIPSKSPETN